MSQKVVVDNAEIAYDLKAPDCVAKHGHLDTKSTECNGLQTSLESAACAHEQAIVSVLQTYYEPKTMPLRRTVASCMRIT